MTAKDVLFSIDHDCRRGDPDDGCRACYEIENMTEAEAEQKCLDLGYCPVCGGNVNSNREIRQGGYYETVTECLDCGAIWTD